MDRDQLFLTVSKNDQSAADFLNMMFQIAHVWDDLIDKDVETAAVDIHNAFLCALVYLPRNAFYRQHFDMLHPITVAAVNNWLTANELERSEDENDRRIAYISRSGYIDLINQVAFIVGGVQWATQVGPVVRRFVHQEGWDAYCESLNKEKAAREPEGE
jgi:hypothetical protein